MSNASNGQCLNHECGARISKNKTYCKKCLTEYGGNKNEL